MFSKLVNKIKDTKFPLVTRKKYEVALENNKINNRSRAELAQKNIELQEEIKKSKEAYGKEISSYQKELRKLDKYISTLKEETKKVEEVVADKTRDVEHYKDKSDLLEKRVKEYQKIINRSKKEVISKHCKKCGRFFRISALDSYKKYCPTCEQKQKEEKRNGRRK